MRAAEYPSVSGWSLILGLGEGLIDFATANILDLHGTLVNFVIYLVFLIVMGLLAGLVYGKMGGGE